MASGVDDLIVSVKNQAFRAVPSKKEVIFTNRGSQASPCRRKQKKVCVREHLNMTCVSNDDVLENFPRFQPPASRGNRLKEQIA